MTPLPSNGRARSTVSATPCSGSPKWRMASSACGRPPRPIAPRCANGPTAPRPISSPWRRAILATPSPSWARAPATRRILREAIGAYRAALGELRRELAPQEWARLQNNLGQALEALSEHEFCEREYGREQLRQAVEAFECALEGQTPETTPAEFAATSVNLGDALLALGEGEATENPAYGQDLLRRAAAAYRAALASADGQTPADAAKTRINLAYALGLLWNGARERRLLDEALAMLDGAIAAISGTREHWRIADAERARNKILAALAQAEAA